MTPPIRMVSVPVALPLKLIDTLKPLAVVAEKLKHCHVVEVCEPTADNPSRNIIPMPREWFERTADDLEAIAVLMHSAGVLSEGQASTLTGLDRVEIRKQVDALTAAPVREEGGAVRQAILDFNVEEYVDGYEFSGDEGFYSPTEDERALLTDAIHGVISELSLTTREEAPAEAGEDQFSRIEAIVRRFPGPIISDLDHGRLTGNDVLDLIDALRAQPPAREDAQPVGYLIQVAGSHKNHWRHATHLHATEADAGKALDRDPDGDIIPLYTHPAPDALREALSRAVRSYDGISPRHRPAWFDQALAALQAEQKGGAA